MKISMLYFTLTRARTRKENSRRQRSFSLSALVKIYIFRSCFLVFYFIINVSFALILLHSDCIFTGSAPVFTGSILRVKQLGAEFIG